jgi:hypothetical protein
LPEISPALFTIERMKGGVLPVNFSEYNKMVCLRPVAKDKRPSNGSEKYYG